MSIECGTVWELLKGGYNLLKGPVLYVMSSKRFTDSLKEEVRKLENEAGTVHVLEMEAERNVRKLHPAFTEWKASAEKALKDARELLDAFDKATKTCCYGTLPDPCCRYQFSTKAEAQIKVVREFAQQCYRFKELNDISCIPAPGEVTVPNPARRVQLPTATASVFSASTSIKPREDGLLESRALMIQNIIDALANNSNSVVGIHGMGGVGKSTLLVDIERRIRKENSFDWVARVDVSENPDIKRIQGEIADALGLTDIKNKETVTGRAELLHKRLEDEGRTKQENDEERKKKKKVLIILDNLWERVDLKSVGIPCGPDNKAIGCKLLLASRDQRVLRREMRCDRDFPLGVLDEEEAKRLFEMMVGGKVPVELEPLVEKALRICAGLPFLIVAIAKLFIDTTYSECNDALKQIWNEETGKVITNTLQLSYGRISKEAKSLLWLCVAYGDSKPSLEYLVRYGVGLGIFRGVSRMQEVRDRFSSLIRTLQASSLLLDDDEDADGFKIHDLVREFVVSVASTDHPLLVLKDKDELITELSEDKRKSCEAICFRYVDLEELPEKLVCPELRIFLLFANNKSLEISDSYFNYMKNLMALDLTGICLRRSPSPFQLLKNLQSLCLDSCSVDNVAILGELKGLQILSFQDSKIDRLPKEIGQLVELRLLDLDNCSRLQVIEPGVLGSLIKLEELYVEDSFDQWNAMEQIPPSNACLIELNNMKNLYTLHISIPDLNVLPEDLNLQKLTKYKIQVGDVRHCPSPKGSSTLQLKLDPISDIIQKGCMQILLGKTDDLFLDGSNGIEQSICALSQEGFPKLKHLQVENSTSVRYVLQSPSHTEFKMLESLLLKDLINLEKVCNNHISSNSFAALKVARVNSCNKMEVLFPLSLLKELPQLEEIGVVNCHSMREIVEADDCGKVELPNLHVLELRDLPNIKNFVTAGMAPSGSTSNGPQVAFFNGQQVSIPSLESLTMVGLPNLEDIWTDESPLGLSNLQFLEVSSCKSLSKVIDSRSLVKLHKLHTLKVKGCVSVQEIFDLDGLGAGANIETLSELNTIHISRLSSLRCIWNKNPCGIVRFHNLKQLKVFDCDNLGFLFFPSMVQSLAQLRELHIRNCKKMETIIMEDEGSGLETSATLAFPMLTNLFIWRLESLMCFSRKKCSQEAGSEDRVKSRYATIFNQEVAFPSLEILCIYFLDSIETIWDDQVAVESFRKLKLLLVYGCNKLVNIVPSYVFGRLKSLESLEVDSCDSLEVVFKLQPLNPLDGHPLAHLPLKKLELKGLSKLKRVWDKELYSQVKFQCLLSVTVSRCESFTSLFPASIARDLMQLEELKIDDCGGGIVELIEKEGLVPKDVFPKLTSLKLKRLPELKCIYTGTHALRWPALKTLEVDGCNKVEILASQPEDEMPLHKQPLFLIEKVAFPSLETLCIRLMDSIEIIWDNQVAAESFRKLKLLNVYGCNKLVNIVPSYILGRLESLESLEVSSCDSLEVVFKLQPLSPLDGHPVDRLPLKKLELGRLSKLKRVWDKELHSQVKFQCLRSITVSTCKSLTSLLPASVARDLMQLEELKINKCDGIVELIKKEGLVLKDVFPKLTSLKLKHLPELKCIYTETHALHWPTLKTLEVDGCRKVEILASQPENEMPLHKQPLFLIEKGAFPNLQEIKLDLSEGMEIWHGHSHEGEFFCKVRVLELHHFSKESAISTCLVQSLTNLQELVVCGSYIEELSNIVEAIEDPSHELKVARFFRHLKTLDVSYCDELSNMFTPTIAGNLVELTKLRISKCKMLTEVICDDGGEEGLVAVFNQLKCMELDGLMAVFPLLEDVIVSGCPSMELFSEGPIKAPKLGRVQVSTKAWFWEENLNITIQNMFKEMATVAKVRLSEFPELIEKWHGELNPIKSARPLESLVVDKCPSFPNAIPSRLILVLNRMQSLQVRDCELLEEVFDLEGLEGAQSSQVLPMLQNLDLVNLPKLWRLWKDHLQGTMCFNLIYRLTLYNCSNLRHAFTPSMARCLANLRRMEIKECGQMEGVIAEEEGQGIAVEKITFPNLITFLSGKNHRMECPILGQLTIASCPKMRSLTWQSLMEIDHCTPSLYTPQVQFPRLESMVLSHMDNLSKIWTNSPRDTLDFEHLQKVKVDNCKSLENLFPYWVATSLNKFEKLRVEFCAIEEIVVRGDDTPHSTTAQVLFSRLTSLVFHDMPQIKSFCPNLPTLNWPFLEKLQVTHCEKLDMLSFVAPMSKWAQTDD